MNVARAIWSLLAVRMLVPPAPVIALLVAAQTAEITVFVMSFAEPNAVGPNLSVVPRMIVGVIIVLIARSRSAPAREKRRHKRRS